MLCDKTFKYDCIFRADYENKKLYFERNGWFSFWMLDYYNKFRYLISLLTNVFTLTDKT